MSLYKIAEMMIEMSPKHEPLLTQSKSYLSESQKTDQRIIEFPNLDKKIKELHESHPVLSIGECEYIIFGTYFYSFLINHKGILLHSSAVVVDNQAYLFSAPSGTGKSTHVQYWLQIFSNAFILNDDKPALVLSERGLLAYGTPFSGKTSLNVNRAYPVKAICLLNRGLNNEIKIADKKTAIANILAQTLRPNNQEMMDQVLAIINHLLDTIPVYLMKCNMSVDAAMMAYNVMSKV